jgi:hypothetical protein
MQLLSVIRRWAFRDQLSIRGIARRTGLSRNTIRKYLRKIALSAAGHKINGAPHAKGKRLQPVHHCI